MVAAMKGPSSMQKSGRGRTGVSAQTMWARLDLVGITLLIVANLVMVSGLGVLFLAKDLAVLGGLQLALILIYGVVGVMRGRALPLLIAGALTIYMMFQTALFHELAGGEINFNAALLYLMLLTFLPFSITRLPLGIIFRIILICAVVYAAIYVLFNPLITSSDIDVSRLVLETDGVRDRRVFLAFQWALFVVLLGIFYVRDRMLLGSALIILGAAAIILANSRMLSVLSIPVVLAAVFSLFKPNARRLLAWGFAVTYLVLVLVIMWGFADNDWNAYSFIAQDNSGTARFLQFQDAAKVIKGHELFGVGIAPTADDLHYFIRPTRPFFAVDLGTAGVFFEFGLLGALLFMAYTVLCIVAIPTDDTTQVPASRALTFATIHAGFSGFFATSLLGTSATIFGALTVGLWLKGGYFTKSSSRFPRAEVNPSVTFLSAHGS